MGGQGQSGTVRFAPHVEEIHQGWFNIGPQGVGSSLNVKNILATTLGFGISNATPYDNTTLTPPDNFFGSLGNLTDSLYDSVDDLEEEADYNRIVDNAVAKVDTAGVLKNVSTAGLAAAVRTESINAIRDAIVQTVDMVDTDILSHLVHAYDKRSQMVRARSTRRFAGTMADINGVQSSAFMFGMAIIEAEHMQSVNQFNSEVSHQTFNDTIALQIDLYKTRFAQELQKELTVKQIRDQLMMHSVQTTVQMLNSRHEMKHAVINMIAEISRVRYVAQTEHEAFDLDNRVKARMWNLEAYQLATVILGGMGGGHSIPKGPSKGGSAIGGALSGAATGAMMGTMVGGPAGTAIGAGAGAILGLGAGLLNA